MDIDTLILSGGSTKGISFLGSLNYLIEKKYIDINFKNIKKITCVSASYLFVLMLILCKYDYKYIENEIYKFNFETILDINNISIKNLINDYGLINDNKNHIYIKNLLKEKYDIEKMSLLKLFNISNIHIIVKVINISEQQIEYIDHINNPKMNILKLLQMTTAIPILLKPITYKGKLYLDGGLCGNCPNEINDSCNYICIDIKSNKVKKEINNIYDFLNVSWKLYDPNILTRNYGKRDIKIDLSELNLDCSYFTLNNELKKKILDSGYNQTKEHINHHLGPRCLPVI